VNARLSLTLLTCSIAFVCSSAWGWQTDMPGSRHVPPWVSPVESSQRIQVGGASIQIDFAPGDLDLSKNDVMQWIETAARAVSKYYGKFPVARARVLVVPSANERGVLAGTTWGDVDGFPAFTRMRIGQHTTQQTLTDDWTMTHEFVHTALPSLSEEHHWLEEGSATYVEPIARAQIGTLSAEQVWAAMVHDMKQGEPQPGDHGLDQTHSWANTYWGGASFCLLADVSIREKTKNKKGLQDALRGIQSAGGSIAEEWSIDQVIAAGDRATGTSVLADLYKTMGNAAYAPIDLDSLWTRLGIVSNHGEIKFDDHAPLAPIREAITASR
jgi:hypothetical protein